MDRPESGEQFVFSQPYDYVVTPVDLSLIHIFGIDWKIPTEHAILSEKDTKHDLLKDFDSPFDINVDLYK